MSDIKFTVCNHEKRILNIYFTVCIYETTHSAQVMPLLMMMMMMTMMMTMTVLASGDEGADG